MDKISSFGPPSPIEPLGSKPNPTLDPTLVFETYQTDFNNLISYFSFPWIANGTIRDFQDGIDLANKFLEGIVRVINTDGKALAEVIGPEKFSELVKALPELQNEFKQILQKPSTSMLDAAEAAIKRAISIFKDSIQDVSISAMNPRYVSTLLDVMSLMCARSREAMPPGSWQEIKDRLEHLLNDKDLTPNEREAIKEALKPDPNDPSRLYYEQNEPLWSAYNFFSSCLNRRWAGT